MIIRKHTNTPYICPWVIIYKNITYLWTQLLVYDSNSWQIQYINVFWVVVESECLISVTDLIIITHTTHHTSLKLCQIHQKTSKNPHNRRHNSSYNTFNLWKMLVNPPDICVFSLNFVEKLFWFYKTQTT